MKVLKSGDVYFENEILKVTYFEEPTKLKNDQNLFYSHFEINFCGYISKASGGHTEWIDKIIEKRMAAYNLIPDGCKVIPKDLVGMFSGLLIGGIMADSIKRVYGICENGIRGFSCSIFFIPSKAYLDSIMDYGCIPGDFKTKNKP